MCNVTIARDKLKNLKSRTEKDLYLLKYESKEFMPLNEDTFFKVKMICNDNNLVCPIFKNGSTIKFRKNFKSIYTTLDTLASEHNIVLDYTKISH
jgi:hypothetical protein